MSPYEQIAEQYRLHPQEESFAYYVEWHMWNGFVFSTPDFFIMGRPVNHVAAREIGVGLWHPSPMLNLDCWYIHAMAGDMAKAWDILPYPLPYIAWERVREGKLELQINEFYRVHRLSHAPSGRDTVLP